MGNESEAALRSLEVGNDPLALLMFLDWYRRSEFDLVVEEGDYFELWKADKMELSGTPEQLIDALIARMDALNEVKFDL